MLKLNPAHVFLSVSGGYDSTALMAYYGLRGYVIHPIHFKYDSKQVDRESKAIEAVIRQLYTFSIMPLLEIEVPVTNPGSLSKNSEIDVESGAYRDLDDVSTVVPGRNLIFLAHIANIAEAYKMNHPDHDVFIASGVHKSDWEQYPDTRPEFVDEVTRVILVSTGNSVKMDAPFCHITKSMILNQVGEHGILRIPNSVLYALRESYSCYRGGEIHCGTCPTCIERHQAFMDTLGTDPTPYIKTPKERKLRPGEHYPNHPEIGISSFCHPHVTPDVKFTK